nr:MAG TPA: hypothetical protein [Caudoviricetes sp.]DAV35419.1 MAG TPA: hypothetical protein [Bacteriophage sp.]
MAILVLLPRAKRGYLTHSLSVPKRTRCCFGCYPLTAQQLTFV